LVLAIVLVCPAVAAAQVTVGQKDDFQDGTTQNWKQGANGTLQPVNVNTGGPAGAGDEYMVYSSHGGSGADSKLVAFNQTQWATTYSPAVNAIDMDLNNLGASSLTIRIAFQDGGGLEYSSAGFALPVGSGWQHADFSLADADMTQLFGTAQPFSTALTNGIITMRIIDAVNPAYNGDSIAAQLGVDNITAVGAAVPEPGSLALFAAAGFAVGGAVRARRKSAAMN
jgi:hypothetical protein